jgi:hypothetical protein
VVSDGSMRASDSDREKVVQILGAAYTEGRLGLDEFDDRTNSAYAAKTWGELRELTSDLPAGASLEGQRATAPPAEPTPSLPPGPRPNHGMIFVPFVPVAIVLLILAVSSHAALLFVPMLIVLFALRAARRGQGPGRGPDGSVPPGASGFRAGPADFPSDPDGHVPPSIGGDPL